MVRLSPAASIDSLHCPRLAPPEPGAFVNFSLNREAVSQAGRGQALLLTPSAIGPLRGDSRAVAATQPNVRFPPIADTGTGVNCLPRMKIEPDSHGERPTISPVEVVAYLITALCITFTINIVLDWLGRKLGTGIMDVGRRHDLGFVLSLFLGL